MHMDQETEQSDCVDNDIVRTGMGIEHTTSECTEIGIMGGKS